MITKDHETKQDMAQGEPGKRFLFITIPVAGHTNPLLPVATALVERGHEVRWYNSPRFKTRIEATGATLAPYDQMRDLDYSNGNEIFPERAQLKGIAQAKWDLKRLVVDLALEQMDDLDAILDAYPADVIVGDSMSLAAMLSAQKRKLPVALINVLNLFAPSIDTAPDGLALPPNAGFFGRLRNRLLNWFVFRVILGDVSAYLRDACVKVGLPPIPEAFFEAPFVRSDLFLQPSIPAFEYPRSDLPSHVHFIGALLPDGPAKYTEPDWWDELEGDRPVVLVTQGTIATDFNNLLIPAMQALANEDLLVIATTGNKPLDGLSLETRPANLRLEPFVPFARLMPHVDLMVTNGGYGGTHFALTNGVPLVAAGTTEDKAEICARIAWSGVGINLKVDSPTAEQIRNAVRTVLSDPHYKRKARMMQAEFARYDAPVQAADFLETLLTTKQVSLPQVKGEIT